MISTEINLSLDKDTIIYLPKACSRGPSEWLNYVKPSCGGVFEGGSARKSAC